MRSLMVALAVVALLVSGCAPPIDSVVEQVTDKAVETATDIAKEQVTDKEGTQTTKPSQSAQPTEKTQPTTVKAKDGVEVKAPDVKVPDALKSFPPPAGFTLEDGGVGKHEDGVFSTAIWSGKYSVSEVTEYYQKALSGQGWDEEFAMISGTAGRLQYNHPGRDELVVGVNKEGDDGILVLMRVTTPK